MGIDAQQRGLAVALVSAITGKYINHIWIPFPKGINHEEVIALAGEQARIIARKIRPLICTVEQPTAKRSPSTPSLWGIYGAVVAGVYPYTNSCESIVVSSWKSKAGLFKWAKDRGIMASGSIPKKDIKPAVVDLLGVSADFVPADIYDAIGIALASYNRNTERLKNAKEI